MRFEKPNDLMADIKEKYQKLKKSIDIKFHRFWVDTKWHLKENYEVYVVLSLVFIAGLCLGIAL